MKYYIVKDDFNKAIASEGKIITPWFDGIRQEGLLSGESNYFIAYIDLPPCYLEHYKDEREWGVAIYLYDEKEGNIKRISGMFDHILPEFQFLIGRLATCRSDFFLHCPI